jgi:hypothetical protein
MKINKNNLIKKAKKFIVRAQRKAQLAPKKLKNLRAIYLASKNAKKIQVQRKSNLIKYKNYQDSKICQVSKNSHFVELGKMLQEKRQKMHIEILQVSFYLKIKVRDVEAIENGDFASLTKHLYTSGLIRSYAEFLKIDRQTIEEKIKFCSFKSNVENRDHQLLNIGEEPNLKPTKDSFFNFLLISILLFLVVLSFYHHLESAAIAIENQSLIEELKNTDS